MKYIPSMVFGAMILCYPAMRVQAAPDDDLAKYLKSCKVAQADVDVVPQLPPDGQDKLQYLVGKDCAKLKSFQATRNYLRQFTPPPSKSPMPPQGMDNDFLTPKESDYVNNVNKNILDKLFDWFSGKH